MAGEDRQPPCQAALWPNLRHTPETDACPQCWWPFGSAPAMPCTGVSTCLSKPGFKDPSTTPRRRDSSDTCQRGAPRPPRTASASQQRLLGLEPGTLNPRRAAEARSRRTLPGLLTVPGVLCDPGTRGASSSEFHHARRQEPPHPPGDSTGGHGRARTGRWAGTDGCRVLSGAGTLLQGQQWLQPARVTARSEVTGVSPAGCSSGCCGAAAGGLGQGQGLAVCFAT